MSGRPCNVSDVLLDMVEAVRPLAHKQQRVVELCELSGSLQVAVEEPALRQALSNLIEGALLRTHIGGKINIVSTGAPAGGTLVVIDDDGPDMHYMVMMAILCPLCLLQNLVPFFLCVLFSSCLHFFTFFFPVVYIFLVYIAITGLVDRLNMLTSVSVVLRN